MAQNHENYYPPISQPYQHRILVYEANGLIGHRLIEQFRNDHIIEVNPNLILGTLRGDQKYSNQLGVDILIKPENEQLLNSAIATSDFILFPLHANNTLQLEHLLKFLKNLNASKKIKVIVISSLFSWKARGNSQVIKKQDFMNRIAHNSAIRQLQNLCLGLNNLNSNVIGSVLNCGLIYGMGQDTLFSLFKQALEQKEPLQVFGRGNNCIPSIHVDDLAQFIYDIAFSNNDGYHFAADESRMTQRQLITSLSQTLGNGKVADESIQGAFLDENFDFISSDIQIEAKSFPKISSWKYKNGLIKNLGAIVGQFNSRRGLKPNKILIHGGPASGKSKLAQTLKKNYGLPVLTMKSLISEIKAEDSPFANQIKGILEQLKSIKIEEERKVYEQIKKKKKGKGMEDFDPSKVQVRLADKDVCRVLKRRINMADCLNKGYIIDGVLKTYSQNQLVFLNEEGSIIQSIFPNSVFNIEANDQEIKDRVKKLTPDVTEGSHWTEQQTVRRLGVFKQNNQGKKWFTFFEGKVDMKVVPFNYTDTNQFINFIERNGPLGFKVKQPKQPQVLQVPAVQKHFEVKLQAEQKPEQEQQEPQEFNLEKLTQSQTKILNEKSRPIRQYLIDNVIPQITQGLLQICKQTPPDPIQFLINFLQGKRNRKRRTLRP